MHVMRDVDVVESCTQVHSSLLRVDAAERVVE